MGTTAYWTAKVRDALLFRSMATVLGCSFIYIHIFIVVEIGWTRPLNLQLRFHSAHHVHPAHIEGLSNEDKSAWCARWEVPDVKI